METTNSRVQVIAQRLLADARAAVTDLKITEDEIHHAAEFLNRLGQSGEFADLLDIFLGVTSVVATLGTPGGTPPNLAGPYYKSGAPLRESGRLFDGELPASEVPLVVRGRVLDVATGQPVTDAILDIWQPDGKGIYDEQGFHLRGLVPVDSEGRYEYHTALPEGYEIPAKGPTTEFLELLGQHNWRPAHIHLRVHVRDATVLQTQFFIGGATYLDSDPVNAVLDELIVEHHAGPDGLEREMNFDIKVSLDAPIATVRLADGPKARAHV